MDENRLIERLRLVEALYAGAGTPGEKEAAGNAMERIRQRLAETERDDPAVEYKFSLPDSWSRHLFVALLRRYGLKPYRYYRQRHTTVMTKVPKRFVDEVLWPEYTELNEVLRSYLEETTERVISQGIYADSSEAEVMKELPGG